MGSTLIFHVVSKRKWKDFNKGGYYNPKGSKYADGIVCINANQLDKYLNENFQGRRHVFVLVIDKSRLTEPIITDEQNQIYRIEHRINMDAILDKISLRANKEGYYDIEVTES